MKKPVVDIDRRKWLDQRFNLHRVGGPALEWDNGNKTWLLHGRLIAYDVQASSWPMSVFPSLPDTFPGYEEAP